MKFFYVVHPQENGKAYLANKLILKGIKKKLDDAKGLWDELLYEILWSYHTTPHLTTKETPFTVVYGADAMLAIEVEMPSWRDSQFN